MRHVQDDFIPWKRGCHCNFKQHQPVKRYFRLLMVMGSLVLAVCFFSKCMNGGGDGVAVVDGRGAGYVGAAACVKCHNPLADSFWHSAHALTSRAADILSVLGNFAPPSNIFDYAGGRRVMMERRDSGLYQVAVAAGGAGSGGGERQAGERRIFSILRSARGGRRRPIYIGRATRPSNFRFPILSLRTAGPTARITRWIVFGLAGWWLGIVMGVSFFAS